jgi:hypothetical protein
MALLTFLGIENPLGVLGPKVRGVLNDESDLEPVKNVVKHTWDVSQYAVKTESNKYTSRAARLDPEIQKLMVEDTVDNRQYVLRLLENKSNPKLRLAMCSSLNSMLKYLANYALQHQGDKFETVIIHGHGAPGGISLGLGQITVGRYRPPGHEKHETRKEMREVFGLDQPTKGEKPEPRRIRELSLNNTDVWTKAFETIKGYVEVSDTGNFHLFLMGCKVGQRKKPQKPPLQKAAAQALSEIIECPVCISAPTLTITEGHLDDLLNRIETIREACAKGDNVSLEDDDKDPVPLVSECAW